MTGWTDHEINDVIVRQIYEDILIERGESKEKAEKMSDEESLANILNLFGDKIKKLEPSISDWIDKQIEHGN